MKERAYLYPVYASAYRHEGKIQPAEVIDVVMYTPYGLTPRLCYEVEYADGFVDYIPLEDVQNGVYEFRVIK